MRVHGGHGGHGRNRDHGGNYKDDEIYGNSLSLMRIMRIVKMMRMRMMIINTKV